MKLTERLKKVADFVPLVSCVADIGTDHAYIPIYLLQNRRVHTAIASDIHAGPLEKAKSHIKKYKLEKYISLRQGAGLSVLRSGEADAIVMAGMGGLMMRDILQNHDELARQMEALVLQPMGHVAELRIWLAKNGYVVISEGLAKEGRHLYEVIQAVRGNMPIPNFLEAEIGVTQGRKQDLLFPLFIKKSIEKRRNILEKLDSSCTQKSCGIKKRDRILQEKERLEALL